MTRRKARECVVCMLYESMYHEEAERTRILKEMKENEQIEGTPMEAFVDGLYLGTLEHLATLDTYIEESSTNWTLERISKIDLSILRMALYELLYTDVPPKVATNEAIEIAKRFSTEKAPKFINGVLGSVIRKQEATTV